jgi:hypothetical protein
MLSEYVKAGSAQQLEHACCLHSSVVDTIKWVTDVNLISVLTIYNACMCVCCGAAVGEEELRHSLGLAAHTTGKGKVALDPNTRPIEVFMCSVVSSTQRISSRAVAVHEQ